MKLLLDTHTLIWWHNESPQLSNTAHHAIANDAHDVYISFANAWEMQIKTQIGRLDLGKSWRDLISGEQTSNGFQWLSADFRYLEMLDRVPLHHRDPFDRLLIAQALAENMTLISKDSHFKSYPVSLLW